MRTLGIAEGPGKVAPLVWAEAVTRQGASAVRAEGPEGSKEGEGAGEGLTQCGVESKGDLGQSQVSAQASGT